MNHPLRTLRLRAGLTQAQLARAAGTSQASVSRIESGEGRIHYGAVLPRLAAALGVGVADILDAAQSEFAVGLDGRRLAAVWLGLDPDDAALDHLRLAIGGGAR